MGHQQGSAAIGYTFVAPHNSNGRINADLWHQYREFGRTG